MLRRAKGTGRDVLVAVSSCVVSVLVMRLFSNPLQCVQEAAPVPVHARDHYAAFEMAATSPAHRQRLMNVRCEVSQPSAEDVARMHGWGLTRAVLNLNVVRTLQARWKNHTGGLVDVLDMSGADVLDAFKGKLNVTRTEYPGVDAHRTPYPDQSFDLVIADQVIEHLAFPHMAVLEMRRVLRPGGLAVITTCAYNPSHPTPTDFWRFMTDGLLMLSAPFSSVLHCGSWGNSDAISARARLGIKTVTEHLYFSMNFDRLVRTNERKNPFSVWVVLVK